MVRRQAAPKCRHRACSEEMPLSKKKLPTRVWTREVVRSSQACNTKGEMKVCKGGGIGNAGGKRAVASL